MPVDAPVAVDKVPDKGPIGWTGLLNMHRIDARLAGKTITLRFTAPKASRKRSRDDREMS